MRLCLGTCRKGGSEKRVVSIRARSSSTAIFGGLLPGLLLLGGRAPVIAQGNAANPSSSPIAITSDNRFVWAVNPDTNTLSAAEVAGDVNLKAVEIPVGREPQSVAISNNNRTLFVTNMVDGTVSVINVPGGVVSAAEPVARHPRRHRALRLRPHPRRHQALRRQLHLQLRLRHRHPHLRGGEDDPGCRRAADGAGHPEQQALRHPVLRPACANGRTIDQNEGADDGREGRVTSSTPSPTPSPRRSRSAPLDPASVGFKSNGSTLGRVPPRNNAQGQPIFDTDTGCFPNILQGIAFKGEPRLPPSDRLLPQRALPLQRQLPVDALGDRYLERRRGGRTRRST